MRFDSVRLILLVVVIFPGWFGGINIGSVFNFLLLLISLSTVGFVVYYYEIKLKLELLCLILFYFILQFLVLLSSGLDFDGGLAVGLTTIRPIQLLMQTLAIYLLFVVGRAKVDKLFDGAIFLTFFMFFSFILFRSVEGVANVFESLYIAPNKHFLDESSILYFSSTYFSGFIFLFFFVLCFSNFLYKQKIIPLMATVFCFVLIFFSTSKTALVAVVLAFVYLVLASRISWFLRLSLSAAFIVPTILVSFYLYEYLLNNRLIVSFIELVSGGGGQNSAFERVEQVNASITGSLENYFLGLGSGIGVLNETFISDFTYRYGLIGLLLYFLFYLFVFVILNRKDNCNSDEMFYLKNAVKCWFIILPVLSMSNPTLEIGKGGVVNCIMLALSFYMISARKGKVFK